MEYAYTETTPHGEEDSKKKLVDIIQEKLISDYKDEAGIGQQEFLDISVNKALQIVCNLVDELRRSDALTDDQVAKIIETDQELRAIK